MYKVLGAPYYMPRVYDPQLVGLPREYNPDPPRKKLPSPDRQLARHRKRLRAVSLLFPLIHRLDTYIAFSAHGSHATGQRLD